MHHTTLLQAVLYLLAAFGLWQLVAIPFYFRKGKLTFRHVEVLPSDTPGVDWAPSGARPLQLIHLYDRGRERTVVRKCMAQHTSFGPMVVRKEAYWEDTRQTLSDEELEQVDSLVRVHNGFDARKEEVERLTKKSVKQLTDYRSTV